MKPRRKPEDDNAPSPFRLQHGDVEQTPIRYGDQRDADPNRPTVARSRKATDNPLAEFLARKLISPEAYHAGKRFGSLWERTTRTVGAVNLDSTGGGTCDGLSYAKLEAMGELHALCKLLGDTEHDRKSRESIVIWVCGERRTVREFVRKRDGGDGGGRACQAVSNMLCIGLERIARASNELAESGR